ncbi:MAG TPA: hypothetical protein VHF47_06840 [Acidimicrobiales bacterium]|nr:hypothetical protein [Acidimicrobiales bacterium]
MPKPSGHRDCRTRELLLALTTDDVRCALEDAPGDEPATLLRALGVQSRAAGRKAPQLVRSRLRGLGHDAARDVALLLSQAPGRFLEDLLPDDDGDLEEELRERGLPALAAAWPLGLVRLTLETLWHGGELTTAARDRLLARLDEPPTPLPASASTPTTTGVAVCDDRSAAAGESALDALLAEAADRPDRARALAAVQEVLALDPDRAAAWYQYGRLAPAPAGAHPAPPARRAFVLGRLRRLADEGDRAALVALGAEERGALEELLARPEATAVAAAVVGAHLDQPRAAARLLHVVAGVCDGWQALLAELRAAVADRLAHGDTVGAELLLRAAEDALWRWVPSANGSGRMLAREATSLALQRVACRRGRSDFVGAARLLEGIDEGHLDDELRAAAACERVMVGAEVAGIEGIRVPLTEAERAHLRARLAPLRPTLLEAVAADAGGLVPNLLLGLLLWCDGDPSAAPCLAEALAQLDERGDLAELRAGVRFHAALARLRLLEPGTDEAAHRDLVAAFDEGHRPGADDLEIAVVALAAHGSPHVGSFLARAVAAAPGSPQLVRLLAERARAGDEQAIATAEATAADPDGRWSLSLRFELLDAALAGAGLAADPATAARLAGAVDDVLVRAGDARLDARFADALAANEALRLALEPAHADALRLEILRRIGRLDEARATARGLFFRAVGGGLRAFDPADLFDVLVELGLAPVELDELARLLLSPPDGEEPRPSLAAPVRVLFVGGNETQERYRAAVDTALAARHGGRVSVSWFLPGWRSNWAAEAARIESAYEEADAVVLMTFVRTHLGQWVRRTAGEHGLPWVACTGHGRVAVERAIERAVAIACERVTVRR